MSEHLQHSPKPVFRTLPTFELGHKNWEDLPLPTTGKVLSKRRVVLRRDNPEASNGRELLSSLDSKARRSAPPRTWGGGHRKGPKATTTRTGKEMSRFGGTPLPPSANARPARPLDQIYCTVCGYSYSRRPCARPRCEAGNWIAIGSCNTRNDWRRGHELGSSGHPKTMGPLSN